MSDAATKPIPRSILLDALSGADVCWHCRGQGSLLVTGPRDRRVCPNCRGSGIDSLAHAIRRTEHKATREVRA